MKRKITVLTACVALLTNCEPQDLSGETNAPEKSSQLARIAIEDVPETFCPDLSQYDECTMDEDGDSIECYPSIVQSKYDQENIQVQTNEDLALTYGQFYYDDPVYDYVNRINFSIGAMPNEGDDSDEGIPDRYSISKNIDINIEWGDECQDLMDEGN